MKNSNLVNIILLAAISSLTASCFGFLDPKEDSTQFYMPRSVGVKKVENLSKNTVVNILPIVMPSYMSRSQIVSLSPNGTVKLAEFNRWAESTHSGFTRVLVSNLSSSSENIEVFAYPSSSEKGLNLHIYINDCVGTLGGTVEMKGKWQITGGDIKISKDFSIKKESEKNYTSYVNAIDTALTELSYDIVKTLAERQNKSK